MWNMVLKRIVSGSPPEELDGIAASPYQKTYMGMIAGGDWPANSTREERLGTDSCRRGQGSGHLRHRNVDR